jgi:hypothetical protein
VFSGKIHFGILYSFTSFSFIRVDVCDTSQLPGLHVVFLSLLLASSDFLFVNLAEFFHDVAC